jgi:uncharacterized membrane protein YbaN (DUF454 family)
MKIGLKVKYTRNIPIILPFLPKNAFLTLEIDFFNKNNGFDKEKVYQDIDYLRKLIN